MTALIELRGVSKEFGSGVRRTTVALRNVTFTLPDAAPSTTAIAGESGSGKTTLARMILGFVKPTSGQVFYRGQDLAAMSDTERRRFRREVQPIFQDPFDVFNPFYRVDHVLTVPIRRFGLAKSRDEARRLIDEALHRVGLRPQDTLGRFPHELSGGQRQRVMVARAVLLRPKVIMADEPVSMVDASLRMSIVNLLKALRDDLGVSVIYITHDLATAYYISNRLIIMQRGRIVEMGDARTVLENPEHPYSRLLKASVLSTEDAGAGKLATNPAMVALASRLATDPGGRLVSRPDGRLVRVYDDAA